MSNGASETDATHEIVAFRLADQDFCIDIMNIREIRCWSPATALPYSPPYVHGLINLRGSVLPIIDLAKRLGLESQDATQRHVIIVVMVGEQLIGLVVDSVSDILTVRESEIQATPSVGGSGGQDFVQGIMAAEDRMIRMLDLHRIFPGSRDEAA